MSKELAVIKEETLDAVSKRIKTLQVNGELHFPPDYSPQNALKSAWLILQNTVDREKRPVLEVCTKASILNSLMDMVITGLNPAKNQGYFIAYGKQLAFQRSYFGSEALAKRIDPEIEDIVAEPVYEGDEFEYEIVRGRKQITRHKQTIESVNSKKIKAAYCLVIGKTGEVKKTELMTFDEIKKAWAKSQMHPVTDSGQIKAGSTHDEFIAEMCRKTVINRTCKPIINSSDDKHLKIAAMRSEVVAAEQETAEQIEYHADREFIDVEPENENGDKAASGSKPEEAKEKDEDPIRAEYIDLRTGDGLKSGLAIFVRENLHKIKTWPEHNRKEIREKFLRFYPGKAYPLDEQSQTKPDVTDKTEEQNGLSTVDKQKILDLVKDATQDSQGRVAVKCPEKLDRYIYASSCNHCEKRGKCKLWAAYDAAMAPKSQNRTKVAEGPDF